MWKVILSLVLVSVLVITLVAYVHSQNETRKVFAAMQKIEDEKMQLKTEWGRLQIEKAAHSASFKVATTAKKSLDMRLPEAEQIMVIKR